MAKQIKQMKIDDVDYELEQLGGVEGLDMFDRLMELLAPTMGEAVKAALIGGKAGEEARLSFAFMEALATLPRDFKKSLWVKFAGLAKVRAGAIMLPLGDGLKLDIGGTYDQHFAGRFGHMTRWLLASMKWSFGDFLQESAASKDAPAATT
jgi:hypothetical protein